MLGVCARAAGESPPLSGVEGTGLWFRSRRQPHAASAGSPHPPFPPFPSPPPPAHGRQGAVGRSCPGPPNNHWNPGVVTERVRFEGISYPAGSLHFFILHRSTDSFLLPPRRQQGRPTGRGEPCIHLCPVDAPSFAWAVPPPSPQGIGRPTTRRCAHVIERPFPQAAAAVPLPSSSSSSLARDPWRSAAGVLYWGLHFHSYVCLYTYFGFIFQMER